MNKTIKSMLTLVALFVATTLSAQNEKDYEFYPYNYIGIQGGLIKNYSGTLPTAPSAPRLPSPSAASSYPKSVHACPPPAPCGKPRSPDKPISTTARCST